ncbi:MAG: LysR substrate-binding domain-containing protein, partial [Pseudomonadota bacterium]
GDADVAIRYGPGGYAGVRVDRLFGQTNTPVCHPDLIDEPNPLRLPGDLKHHTLLHIAWKDMEASWRMWLLAAGVTGVDAASGPRFGQEAMAVEAALQGQGVALVGDRLVADHIASGRLVQPFGPGLSAPLSFAYYLLTAKRTASHQGVAAFRDWILKEAQSVLSSDGPSEGPSRDSSNGPFADQPD